MDLMRYGVYGFRPDESDDEIDDRTTSISTALPLPTVALPVSGYMRAPSQPSVQMSMSAQSQQLASLPVDASSIALPQPTPELVPGKNDGSKRTRKTKTKPQRQFYCATHKRLRYEDCLMDDEEGNPIC